MVQPLADHPHWGWWASPVGMVGIPTGDGVFFHIPITHKPCGDSGHTPVGMVGIPSGDGGIQKWLRREQLNKMVPKLRDHKTIAIQKINEWSKKMC